MEKAIRIRILGREYTLRADPANEAITRQLAAYVDEKLRTFKRAHPEQPEITALVITALALAEELFTARDAQAQHDADLDARLSTLADRLDLVLEEEAGESPKDAG